MGANIENEGCLVVNPCADCDSCYDCKLGRKNRRLAMRSRLGS